MKYLRINQERWPAAHMFARYSHPEVNLRGSEYVKVDLTKAGLNQRILNTIGKRMDDLMEELDRCTDDPKMKDYIELDLQDYISLLMVQVARDFKVTKQVER
jgi:hypothetical protein